VKSLTVVPHSEATLTTNVGFPLKALNEVAEPSSLFAEKSEIEAMLTAARVLPMRVAKPVAVNALPSVAQLSTVTERSPKQRC